MGRKVLENRGENIFKKNSAFVQFGFGGEGIPDTNLLSEPKVEHRKSNPFSEPQEPGQSLLFRAVTLKPQLALQPVGKYGRGGGLG